jgi:DNA replication protein DnaC
MTDGELRKNVLPIVGLPAVFHTLRDTDVVKRAEACMSAAVTKRKPIVLIGPVASGKSLTLAVAVHNLMRRRTTSCAFVNVADLYARLSRPMRSGSVVDTVVDHYMKIPHLMLDDLGSGYDKSGWFTTVLYRIVDARMCNELHTWASLNDEAAVDARVLRRVTENALVVQLEGGA